MLLLAACSSGGPASTGAPASSAPDGTCPTAPAPAENLEGWSQPATSQAIVPYLINSIVSCGQNRLIFTVLDSTGVPIGGPDLTATIKLYNLGRDSRSPIATADGEFVWAIEDERGIYVANAEIAEAGRYGAEVTTARAGEDPVTTRLTFDVQPASPVVKVGDHAPASKTPTLADVGGDATKISTDSNPDPAFYETSVDQALAAHEPFVLIFATPKFCLSAQCGPTLDRIKPYASAYPTVTFINVEPYKLVLVDGTLRADLDAGNQLQPVATTDEWHLLTEPNVFVVDRGGIVTANFELIFSDRELTAALDAVR